MTDRVVVVGLGVMGAQTLLHLAEAGVACTGIERRTVGHPHGSSSGGATRIFRTGWDRQHHDALSYARERWSALTHEGRPVLSSSGALTVGHHRDPRMAALLARSEHGGVFSQWRSEATRERWPHLLLAPDDVAVLDERGGLLDARAAVVATLALARRLGAEVVERTTVTEVRAEGSCLQLLGGDRAWSASRVVCTTGGRPAFWPGPPARDADLPQGRRVALAWVEPREPVPSAAYVAPGVRFLADDEAVSFFPPVDEWGWKVNYMPSHRPPAAGSTHPGLTALDLAALDAAAHFTLRGLRTGLARAETHVEWYSRSGEPVHLADAGGRLTAVTGFSGNGFRLAPWVGRGVAGL